MLPWFLMIPPLARVKTRNAAAPQAALMAPWMLPVRAMPCVVWNVLAGRLSGGLWHLLAACCLCSGGGGKSSASPFMLPTACSLLAVTDGNTSTGHFRAFHRGSRECLPKQGCSSPATCSSVAPSPIATWQRFLQTLRTSLILTRGPPLRRPPHRAARAESVTPQ